MTLNGDKPVTRRDFLKATCTVTAFGLSPFRKTREVPVEGKRNPGKWGYVDQRGNMTISPHFDRAGSFREGLACATSRNLSGYIDRTGGWAITPRFDAGGAFGEGLAPVMKGDRWGFIDRKGHIVIEPQFEYASPFDQGLAEVKKSGVSANLIDASGRMVFEPPPAFYGLSEGLAVAIDREGYFFVDRQGDKMFDRTFDLALPFSEGMAVIVFDNNRRGFIDRCGTVLTKSHWCGCGSVSEGLAVVVTKENNCSHMYGYIDKIGNTAIECRFDDARDFASGVAPVRQGDRWALIDAQGTIKTPYKFEWVGRRNEGLASAMADGKWGFVDVSGTFVVPPRYASVYGFSEGLAAVKDCPES
ncbi:MAG: WG repeat-containing protein [Syntrophorhabdales bacterium]|jgi:hypothetical protein